MQSSAVPQSPQQTEPSERTRTARAGAPITTVHVIDGLLVQHGGPSYTVPAIAKALAQLGADVKLRTVAPEPSFQPQGLRFEHTLHQPAPGFLGSMLRASADLERTLLRDAESGVILHAHCLWLMPNVYPAWARRRTDAARLVHSIRGMLSPEALNISRWKKLPFWHLYQKAALEAADCLHATAEAEYQEIRSAGLKTPVAVIPNAIELPGRPSVAPDREKKVLSLGRLHPKKGLDRLIRAWSSVESEYPQWRLQIVGSAELGYDDALRALSNDLGCQRVSIEGPVYGPRKLDAYRTADLFVLSSLNENFAVTVAEALGAETPVISTKGAPWRGLEANRCGWWIDHGVEPLIAALREAMSLPAEERRAMGARGRAWIAEDFSWPRVAADMLDVYRWLYTGGTPPPTVRMD